MPVMAGALACPMSGYKRKCRRATSSCDRRRSATGCMAQLRGGRRPEVSVDLVKKFTRIYPLSQAANPPPMKFVDLSGVTIAKPPVPFASHIPLLFAKRPPQNSSNSCHSLSFSCLRP
jgi:hypothetical protein